jgi:acyl-CoA thioesterase-1
MDGGPPADPPRIVAASGDSTPVVVFAGTSLTAGYGLPSPDLAYPALIQRKIDSLGLGYRVINAGVSGETSAGLLRRIGWVLEQGRVAVLVVETGANDGLRGQDPDSTRANIQAILDQARAHAPPPRLLLAGMEAMPNLGRDYTTRFREIFPELARRNGAALVPFLLDGVAGVDSLNQADGIHPTARGQEIVAGTVWPVLRGLLSSPSP